MNIQRAGEKGDADTTDDGRKKKSSSIRVVSFTHAIAGVLAAIQQMFMVVPVFANASADAARSRTEAGILARSHIEGVPEQRHVRSGK